MREDRNGSYSRRESECRRRSSYRISIAIRMMELGGVYGLNSQAGTTRRFLLSSFPHLLFLVSSFVSFVSSRRPCDAACTLFAASSGLRDFGQDSTPVFR